MKKITKKHQSTHQLETILSPAELAEVAERYQGGQSLSLIAYEMQIGIKSLRTYLEVVGLKKRRAYRKAEPAAEGLQAIEQGAASNLPPAKIVGYVKHWGRRIAMYDRCPYNTGPGMEF